MNSTTAADATTEPALPRAVRPYVAGVTLVAVGLVAAIAAVDDRAFERVPLMVAFGAVLVAEHLFEGTIRRESGQRESYGHEESFLVAMALLSSPLTVALVFAGALVAGNLLLRRDPLKGVFNVGALTAAAAAGLLLVAVAGGSGPGPRAALVVVLASLVFIVIDNVAVSGVLALARATTFRRNLVDDLGARSLIWAGNTAIGLLAGLAGAASSWTLPFGLVAMFALHFAFAGHIRARAEQQKLGDIVGSSSDGIFSVDSRARIVSWNRACELITGHGEARVFGLTLAELLTLVSAEPDHEARVARPAAEEATVERLQIRAADGTLRLVALTQAPLPEGGSVALMRDETTQRQVDELVARQESERLKSDLLATVSHELRTPLTSILGFTSTLLTRDVEEGERRQYLEIVRREASRLATLIDDLLDLRRMSEGRFVPADELVDVREVVAHQVEVFAGQSARHALVLELAGEPLLVAGERARLSQVVSNLLSNAIKYSPDGGEVRVTAAPADGRVRVAVSDRGLGIPDAAQSEIFTRFFRVETPAHRSVGGTGLGLALAREIVEAHGGTIGFESAEGAGSVFWVELPSAEA